MPIQFSVTELLEKLSARRERALFAEGGPYRIDEVEDALLYLSKIGAMKLEGGFLVIYNAMEIHRLADMKNRYKVEDYRMLDEFYKQKIRQIHIVGEYANLMVKDYAAALRYVRDYFQMDFRKFIAKYFKGDRLAEIGRNITPRKHQQLFGALSPSSATSGRRALSSPPAPAAARPASWSTSSRRCCCSKTSSTSSCSC